MKIIIPNIITPSLVVSNSAVNAYADYSGGTTYALDVLVTYNERYYKSLQSSNTGNTPGLTSSTAWWADQGPSNKAAMFDGFVSTKTTASNSLSFTIEPINANSIGLVGIEASQAVITASLGASVIYTRTINLQNASLVTNWVEYFFNEVEYQTDIALTDLPPIPGISITVTLTKPSANVALGLIVLGKKIDGGSEQYGLKREGIDWSKAVFDEFGVLSVTKREYAKKFSSIAHIPNGLVNMLTTKLDSIASVPVLVIGSNDTYSSLIVYGLVSYSIELTFPSYSFISYDIKGLI
jgi:hypothetical protein